MKDVNKLKREKTKIVERMKTICEDAQKRDDSRMTEAEGDEYQKLEADKEKLAGQIELAERSNALEMEQTDEGSETEPENRSDENGFKNLGEMLIAVRNAAMSRSYDERLTRAATGLGKDIPSDGGFLIQDNHMAGLERKMFEKSVLAGKCQKINVGANANRLTWNELKESSRANGSRHGGILGYWVAEGGTITASAPEFTRRSLELEKVAALYYATNEFEEDTGGQSMLINELVSDELAFQLDNSIFNGTGSGKPLGVLKSNALISVSAESGQSADTIVFENVSKMRARLWAKSRKNAAWYINQDCEHELGTMAYLVGTGGVPVYMPASGINGSPYDTLYGMPVIPTEYNSTVGDLGDILLADLSQYRLIDKGGIKGASSIHVQFLTDQMVWRFTYRVNGMPLWSTALTPFKGSNTQSPFVGLAART